MSRNSDDECQSSDEQETHYGNNDDAVHISKKKDVAPEPCGPGSNIIQTHSRCHADSSYTVVCTVSMVLAVPKGYEDDPVMATENERHLKNQGKSKCIVEAPKAQAYYHIEYNLLPDDSKPIKVDLVMFGSMAKVYMDKRTKVLKPWQEGEHLWLSWSQTVKLNVTKELLIKMSSHKITFKLWDTKDRVSSKAKYDRPKAFRRIVEEPQQRGGIQGMVYKLRALYEKQKPTTTSFQNSQKDIELTDYQQPSELRCNTDDLEASGVSKKPLLCVRLNTDGSLTQRVTFSKQSYGGKQNHQRGPKISTSEATADQGQDMALSMLAQKRSLDHGPKGHKDATPITSTKSGTLKDESLAVSKEKVAHQTVQERTAEEDIRKNGAASAELRAAHFLAGEISLTDCLMIRYRRSLKGLCSITLDQPLMSEELKAELNPLIITISSASSLPSTPVSFSDLKDKCMPVYCQYKFHNMPTYRTKGQSHSSNIYFNDVNVILTGLHSTEELFEFLRGPPIEIEIHDRDRKAQGLSSIPAIFGTEGTDDKLASTALVFIKETSYSPFKEIGQACDSFGVAKLNFSDLLRGHRHLKLSLPIISSHPAQSLGTQRNRCGETKPEAAGTLDAQDNAIPSGHYLKANSELEVQVEIAHPFNPEPDGTEGHCPFGRIIYIFNYNNLAFLEQLRSEILQINAVAFQLHSYSEETSKKKLHGLLMDATERENKHLDALTGFHFLDEALHLFVLEGLKHEAVRKLWETVHIRLTEASEKQVVVLYNSGLSFSKRLYDTLDVGLSPIHLHKPLETIMRQPLVYIKDTVPNTCLQAMIRISHICLASKLEEVVQNNLFPSAEMVQSLRNEFGIIPSKEVETLMPDSNLLKVILHPPASHRKTHTPIDNRNEEYLTWKRIRANQELCTKSFIQANIKDIQTATRNLQTLKPTVFVAELDDRQTAHNYSIQTINSTSLAKKLLFEEMAKKPDRRFTYSQHYHSFTVDAVDVEAERKASEARSRAAWQTCDGFILQSFRDSMESNKHPKHPGEARVEELEKPWKENLIHENILKPVLNRTRWPWGKRQKDLELYKKPPAVLNPVPPITIHLAGETLHQEQLQAAHAQYNRWLNKVLPDRESASCGRVPEFKCHMQKTGLDKLHDILKDKPRKLSLKAWRGTLVQVYAHTIQTRRRPRPYTDTMTEEDNRPPDRQTNPRHASEHSKCQFGRFWRSHSFQHKRTALPLTDKEKSLHVFQTPQDTTQMYTDFTSTQHKCNVIQTRTNDSVTLHIQ